MECSTIKIIRRNKKMNKEKLELLRGILANALLNYEDYDGNDDVDNALSNAKDEIDNFLEEVL